MNTLAILIIFGLATPIINYFVGALMGNDDEYVKDARADYVNDHRGASVVGAFMSFIVPIVYWIYVIVQTL